MPRTIANPNQAAGATAAASASSWPLASNLSYLSRMPLRICLAECLGTFALVFAGTGAIVIDDLSGGEVTNLGIGICFGLIVAAMIFVLGAVSGAHINPAVTASLALARRFPVRLLPWYWAAQLFGAAAASFSIRGLFGEAGGLGATLPSDTAQQSFGLEIIITFILMLIIIATVTDAHGDVRFAAIAVGGAVALAAIFAGPISGASMNPARSFGPALASGQWESHWVYWAGPLIGAAAAPPTLFFLRGASSEQSKSKRRAVSRRQVLFVCIHNAGRSQMAAAFFNHYAQSGALAVSAGATPASHIHPNVIKAMQEKGLDLSEQRPKLLTQDLVDASERIITMGCSIEEACPAGFLPSEDWGLPDPADKPLDEVGRIRDEIERRVLNLITEMEIERQSTISQQRGRFTEGVVK